MSYREKSWFYQLVGPLGILFLLAACFLLCVNTLFPELIAVTVTPIPATPVPATASTTSSGDIFLGLTGCVLVGSVAIGVVMVFTLRREVGS